MSKKSFFGDSTLVRATMLLPKEDRKKVLKIAVIQMTLGLLDLLGVALIGALTALAIRGFSSQPVGGRVSKVVNIFGVENYTLQTQIAFLGVTAVIVLIGRTLLSIFFTRKILMFLSRKAAEISTALIARLLNQPLLYIQSKTSQQFLWALTAGVTTITVGIIGIGVNLLADITLLILLFIALVTVQPFIALCSFIFFVGIGLFLFKNLNEKARSLGFTDTKLNIKSNEKIFEIIKSYREIVVRDRRAFYRNEMSEIRSDLAITQGQLAFIPYVSKYVIETSVVVGALLICALQFTLSTSAHAVTTLSIFLAAGTRIAPAVLRIQQGAVNIKGSLGLATPTLELADEIGDYEFNSESVDIETPQMNHDGFTSTVKIDNLSFRYPGSDKYAISNISLEVEDGQTVALVGKTGSGKSTLADLMLGVLQADSGTIEISNSSPSEAISHWPGAISYVPQDVFISNATLRENITLGFPSSAFSDKQVWEALEFASLGDFTKSLPKGLETTVGEFGSNVSGGQRQRIGLARAIICMPKLIILDEATSSLDSQTEEAITRSIKNLNGKCTVIVIAHRLSTIKEAKKIFYIDSGELVASGSFEEVRSRVTDFDYQALLSGIKET
jgi:ABC-type multidrug transport system fused ATPase/permease subunit